MLIESVEVLIVLVLVIALLVMSVIDFALSGVNKIALRRIGESATKRRRRLIGALGEKRSEVLMAVHLTIQTCLVAITVLVTDSFLRYSLHYAVALPAAAGTVLVLVLVFRQLIPRAIAHRSPETVLVRLLPALGAAHFCFHPPMRLVTSILNHFQSWETGEEPEGEDEASEEEIQAFIDAGQEEGILEQDEGVMIQSIVQFGDKLALEVMTPRTQIVAADVSAGVDKLINLVVSSHHSRIPIFRGQLDNLEGIVHERDLLRIARSGDETENLRSLLHPAHFVPETKPIDDLLEEMKVRGQQLVLVVDEYGGISGLITIEDLVEEIVGEINDGSQSNEAKVLEEEAGSYLVPGGMELDAIDDRLGVSVFPDTECTTAGGAVVELFGRLPSSGERIRHEGFTIEVVSADRRKVRSLRIRILTSQAES